MKKEKKERCWYPLTIMAMNRAAESLGFKTLQQLKPKRPMKKETYRKIRKSDKLPILPKRVIPIYIIKERFRICIFGEDKKRRYTFEWDGFSKYPDKVSWNLKRVRQK